MRKRLFELIDTYLLEWQMARIYHHSSRAWSHLKLIFRCACRFRGWVGGWRLYLIEKCGWTACCPVGTTTTVYLWSTLAAALPNGIFLEITASKCDMLACVCLCCWRSACVWTIVIKQCAFACESLSLCVCGWGSLEPRCTENMFCCHMGLVETWLNGCREPSLASCSKKKRRKECSDVGSGYFHTAAFLVSNRSSSWIDTPCPTSVITYMLAHNSASAWYYSTHSRHVHYNSV